MLRGGSALPVPRDRLQRGERLLTVDVIAGKRTEGRPVRFQVE